MESIDPSIEVDDRYRIAPDDDKATAVDH